MLQIMDYNDPNVLSVCCLAHSTCQYDGLKIYSLATSGPPVATVCGSSIPGPFTTFGSMLLHFYSDYSMADNGFMAEYSVFRK